MKFYYVYKALAHPEQNGYITPYSLPERLLHVAEAKQQLGSRIEWLCDSMTNDLKHALGNAPNSEFLIDPDGHIASARRWSRPQELRDDLADRLGAVKPATKIAELGMRPLAPPRTAAKGVVPRVQLPGRMTAVKVRPVADPSSLHSVEPFYVKLRAEIEQQYFQEGAGKLYLGFFLDPLYKVHWNNRATPIEFEFQTADAAVISPPRGVGPEVEAAADADPREFLVDVSGAEGPVKLTVKYFACDDAETFCKPVTQHYEIVFERDRDAGSRRSFGSRGGRFAGDRRRFGGGPGGPFGPGGFRPFERQASEPVRRSPADEARSKRLKSAVTLFKTHDRNGDGQLDQSERDRIGGRLTRADTNSDGLVSLRELIDWRK